VTRVQLMEFERDPAKSEATYRRRGFDFAYASRIFDGVWIADQDRRFNYGETRYEAIGQVDADLLVVIFTARGGATRIISARGANRKERAQWLSRA
jgi:uncharacterized DUF497 family protein